MFNCSFFFIFVGAEFRLVVLAWPILACTTVGNNTPLSGVFFFPISWDNKTASRFNIIGFWSQSAIIKSYFCFVLTDVHCTELLKLEQPPLFPSNFQFPQLFFFFFLRISQPHNSKD